ncbi:hypothetical protein VQH23_06100 [Pararoseomonas sp. SCSIO 73927]|uniref:hypothetical protein n=1 Tax=Pararoseomonas sp. SCSIO 73927 TaxID=3114537 RepID=UPI0030CD631E
MAALLLLSPYPAPAQGAIFLPTAGGNVLLSLPASGVAPVPVVLILPDQLGADGRERPYAERLLEGGIAVLTVEMEGTEAAALLRNSPWLRDIVRRIAPGRLDGSRIGLLGFGGGGRAALSAPADLPVAALYPSCAGLTSLGRTAPALVLHPDDPAETVACRHLAPLAEVLEGAAHGWDHGQGPWANTTSMMPHPDGSGARIPARGDHWATEEAAGRVLRHFTAFFGRGTVPVRPSEGPFHAAAGPEVGIPAGAVRPRR